MLILGYDNSFPSTEFWSDTFHRDGKITIKVVNKYFEIAAKFEYLKTIVI